MKKNSSRFFRVCYAIFAWAIKLIFRVKVIYPENEPDEGGYLICANHASAIDAVVVCYAFKKNQAMMMAKKELFKIPLLAQLIKLLGAFPVDRGGGDVSAIKKSIALIKEGKCVGMFPQGHRYPGVDPRTTEVKKGAGLIVSRAECGAVPVYILRKNNKPRMFGKTYVVIGKKMEYADLVPEGDYDAITAKIFSEICDLGDRAMSDPAVKL